MQESRQGKGRQTLTLRRHRKIDHHMHRERIGRADRGAQLDERERLDGAELEAQAPRFGLEVADVD